MDRAQIISYANHIESTHGVLTRGLLVSLIIQESNFDIWAAGKAGELGLTQIMPATMSDYRERTGKDIQHFQLIDPKISIEVGAWYLYSEVPRILQLEPDPVPVTVKNILEAYNGGPGNVRRQTVSTEAQFYAQTVAARAGYNPSILVRPGPTGFALAVAGLATVVLGVKRWGELS